MVMAMSVVVVAVPVGSTAGGGRDLLNASYYLRVSSFYCCSLHIPLSRSLLCCLLCMYIQFYICVAREYRPCPIQLELIDCATSKKAVGR